MDVFRRASHAYHAEHEGRLRDCCERRPEYEFHSQMPFCFSNDGLAALYDKAPVEPPDHASVNRELASQLQTCVQAIEAKQPDLVIGKLDLVASIVRSFIISILSAQSAGQDIWEAIHTMVKNVSEAMLTPLPNFWRISKSFMEGRYKKVSLAHTAYICVHQHLSHSNRTLRHPPAGVLHNAA